MAILAIRDSVQGISRSALAEARAKWHEVVTFEDGRETIRGDIEGQKYTLRPPVVYREQIVPPATKAPGGKGGRPLNFLDTSYLICYSGIRGNCKTASLTFAGMYAMTLGMDCYSNYPIEFILVEQSGEHKRLKANVVTVGDMIDNLDKWFRAFICGDEFQDIVGNYDYSTTKSKLVNGRVARIRKAESSMGYTSKFVNWVTTRTRDELDIEFACRDAANTPWGYGKYQKGAKALWTAKDYSGVWTGYIYNERYPVPQCYLIYLKPMWGAYDTKFSVDILESMRGVKVDMEKRLITDKNQKDVTVDPGIIRTQLISIFEAKKKKPVYNSELWTRLGIEQYDRKNRQIVQEVMNTLGIEKTQNGYRRDYALVNT